MFKRSVIGACVLASASVLGLVPASPAAAASPCETPAGYKAGAPFTGEVVPLGQTSLAAKVTHTGTEGYTELFNLELTDSATTVKAEVLRQGEGSSSYLRYWDGTAWVNLWPDGGVVCDGDTLSSVKGTLYRNYKKLGTFSFSR